MHEVPVIARNHTGHRCGERHHRAKLTDSQVREMRTIYAEWKVKRLRRGYSTLAAMFGCGVSTARDIITLRTRWAA